MNYEEALRYLDEHASYEKTGRVESPSLDNISRFMDLMANPQLNYPVIHVTGTNGKGSTTQIITKLLMAHGLQVGTYTSPHLEALTERITRDGEQIGQQEFADCVAAIADIEVLAGVRRSIVGDELSEQIPIEEIQLPLGTLAPLLACQILWVPLELFTPLCVGSRIAVGIRRPKSPSKPLPSEKRRIMKIPSMRVLMSNRVAQSQTRLARLVGQVPR
jgi:hypothetical protein